MWSHYSLSHTGVCLKFEILKDPEFFSTPLKVIYSDEYPVYNHLRDGSVLVDKLLKTKSTCWAYEQELRVVKHLTKGLQKFEKGALVEIIFGCRVEKKEIERIKILAQKAGFSHLIFTKCKVKLGKFGLDFIPA